MKQQMEAKFLKQFPGRKLLDIISSTRIWKMQHNAAVIIQRAWRAYLKRKRVGQERTKSNESVRSSDSGKHKGGRTAMDKIGQFFHLGGGHSGKRKSSAKDPGLVARRKTSTAEGNC